MSGIKLKTISKAFGTSEVLKNVELDIAQGEFVAILGRSGSGKSTLLRIVARLDQATSGTLHASDRLAVAFQEARLVPWLSVIDNISFGMSVVDKDSTALAALEEVGLTDKARVWPLTLSGGQAQRVSLARALVREPEILLLDEPFAALDALTRLEMQNLVGSLWRRHQWTVVMVTHDVDEAIRLATRVVILANGRITHDIPVPGRGPREQGATDSVLARHLLDFLGVPTAPPEVEI